MEKSSSKENTSSFSPASMAIAFSEEQRKESEEGGEEQRKESEEGGDEQRDISFLMHNERKEKGQEQCSNLQLLLVDRGKKRETDGQGGSRTIDHSGRIMSQQLVKWR
jgi:hypothetical protein